MIDPIAAAYALRLERIGEPADFGVQLPIGQLAHIARFAFEHDRDLVAAARPDAHPGNCATHSVARR